MTNPPVFTWSDRFLLGHRTIDDTHREFVECVDALLRASDAEKAAAPAEQVDSSATPAQPASVAAEPPADETSAVSQPAVEQPHLL